MERGLREPIDIAQHILVYLAGGFGHNHHLIIVQVDLPAQVIDSFFDELRQIRILLKIFGEFHILDERTSDAAVHLLGEFIAIVEALAERLYLVALVGQLHDVLFVVVFKIKHELLCTFIKSDTHNC